MSLTYAQYVTAMKTLMVVDSETNARFVAALPLIISYAEERIYSEFDFLTVNTEVESLCSIGSRTVAVPTGIKIVQSAAIITPAGSTATAGKRNNLQRASVEFLDAVWPTEATTGVPQFYALQTDTSIRLAPTPDAAYKLNARGPITPTPLSVGNPTTYLTINLDSLFLAASMVFAMGVQRNFGAQSDDPKVAISWESQYQTLKAAADIDELRRKAQSYSWQPYSPAPEAKESRT